MTRKSKREIRAAIDDLEAGSDALETLSRDELHMLGLKQYYGHVDLTDEEAERVWELWEEKVQRAHGRIQRR